MNNGKVRPLFTYIFKCQALNLMFLLWSKSGELACFLSFKNCFQVQPHYVLHNKGSTVEIKSHEETKSEETVSGESRAQETFPLILGG